MTNVKRQEMKKTSRVLLYSGLMIAAVVPELAQAAVTFGDMGNNLATSATGMAAGAYKLFVFGGLMMAGMGIIMAGMAHKKHESAMPGVGIFLAGALLASIVVMMQSGSQTVLGSDSTSLGKVSVSQ